MKKLLWAGLAAIVILVGCTNPSNNDPLVGSWNGVIVTFTFNANNTFTETALGVPISGTYTDDMKNSQVHLTVFGASAGDWSYVFGPGNLTVTFTGIGGTTSSYTLTRQ